MKKKSQVAQPELTEGSHGGHLVSVTLGGPAVEAPYTRNEFLRDLTKASKRQSKPDEGKS